jgi:hypothetical protein
LDKTPTPPNIFLPPKDETPVKGVFIYTVIVMVSIVVLANVYSFLNIHFPLTVVKSALPFAYSMLIGYFMSWGIFLGKIRGMKNVILLALVGSIVSTYFFWSIWTAKMLDESMFNRVGSLFQGLDKLNIQGISIGGEAIEGFIWVRILWILETLFVFLVPIFVVNDKPPRFSSLVSKN